MHPSALTSSHAALLPGYSQPWTRREKNNVLGSIAFVAVLGTTLFDLNALLRMITDRSQVASPILLICCITSFIAFRFQFKRALGISGMWFVGAYLFFIFFGSVVRLLSDFDQTEIFILTYWLRMHLTSIVILLATALGARYFALRHSPEKTLFLVLGIGMLQVLATLFSKQLGSTVFGSSLHAKYDSLGRATGLLGNPNATGNLMVAVAAVAFACMVTGKWRIPVLGCLFATAVACIMTFSRSSWIALFLLGVSQVFYSPVVRKKAAFVASAAVAVGIVWFIMHGAERFQLNERQQKRVTSFSDIYSGEYDELDTGNRAVQARIGLVQWAKSPLIGHGLGTGSRIDTDYGLTLGPHNHFILVLVEAGIIGLIPYLIFFGVAVWASWKCTSKVVRTFALGYLLAYLCHNLTGHNVPTQNYHAVLLGVMFGLLAAVALIDKQQRRAQRAKTAVRPQPPVLAAV